MQSREQRGYRYRYRLVGGSSRTPSRPFSMTKWAFRDLNEMATSRGCVLSGALGAGALGRRHFRRFFGVLVFFLRQMQENQHHSHPAWFSCGLWFPFPIWPLLQLSLPLAPPWCLCLCCPPRLGCPLDCPRRCLILLAFAAVPATRRLLLCALSHLLCACCDQ